MGDSKHLGLRDSRDRIVDLLGIGETYPLRDISVTEELKVPFSSNARIALAPSQSDVRYELRDSNGDGPPGDPNTALRRDEDGSSVPVETAGTGAAIELVTPAIDEDATFTVLAAKRHPTPDGPPSVRSVYLHLQPRIKVGLDATLVARVLTGLDIGTEFLDGGATTDADARLVHFATTVTVAIVGAQEGVDYELVSVDGEGVQTLRCVGDVRGRGESATITIDSLPLHEDVDLRVRATKSFAGLEDRATEIILLDAVLPVRVRADTTLEAVATTVIAYGASSSVTIAATQRSAFYQLFARPVRDREFTPEGTETTADVPVAGEATVHIARPAWSSVWDLPAGFVAIGEAQAGTGDALDLPLGELVQDTLVIVRAHKSHTTAGEAPATVESAVQLLAATATLVGPTPTPQIELRVVLVGGKTSGIVEVLGGQPGVYYHLRRTADGDDLGLAAYVHQLDDVDDAVNKGIGQLAIGVDLLITRDDNGIAETALDRKRPQPPQVWTGPLSAGDILHLHAVKAQTRVSAVLAKTAELTPLPAIDSERVGVDRGLPAKVRITPSQASDSYQLRLYDRPVGDPQTGTGETLILTSEPVLQDQLFEVLVSPTEDRGIPVHRTVPISVPLRPKATLGARIIDTPPLNPATSLPLADATPRLVAHGAQVEVELTASEADTSYRLVTLIGDQESVISADFAGDGQTIKLRTQVLREDIDLRVRAIRHFYGADDELEEPRRILDAVMPIAVRADPELVAKIQDRALVDYRATPTIKLAKSQKSASYTLFVRAVADDERIFDAPLPPGSDPLSIETGIEGRSPLQVHRPTWTELWDAPQGFVQAGATVAGTGQTLSLVLPPTLEDQIILIRASKDHAAEADQASAVQLSSALLVLVRPDTTPQVRLVVAGLELDGAAQVSLEGGESGVLYQLLQGEGDTPLGEPLYVHGQTAEDDQVERGVGRLRILVDLAVAGQDPQAPTAQGLTLTAGEALSIEATRAQTGLRARLDGAAGLFPTPQISAEASSIAAGESATLTVTDSVVGQSYQIILDDAPFGDPTEGTGENIILTSPAIESSSTLIVEITRPQADGIAVAHRLELPIEVT